MQNGDSFIGMDEIDETDERRRAHTIEAAVAKVCKFRFFSVFRMEFSEFFGEYLCIAYIRTRLYRPIGKLSGFIVRL